MFQYDNISISILDVPKSVKVRKNYTQSSQSLGIFFLLQFRSQTKST